MALILIVAACGAAATPTTTTTPMPDPSIPQGTLLKANLPRDTTTDISDTELALLVDTNTALAFDIFRIAAADGGNLILSPYSIAAALTMAYAGARGDTAAEMRDALSFGLSDNRLHSARNQLDLLISAIPERLEEDEREPFNLRVANSIWGQAGYPFLEDFLNQLASNYDAGMRLVDFVTAAEDARQSINAWVEEQTEGRIVNLIPEGAVDDMTRLVLVNAIWFKANWAEPFNPDATISGPFNLLDGSQVTASLMQGSIRTGYTGGDGYQAFRLPYAGDAAMIVVLPNEGRFAEVASSFDGAELARVRQSFGDYQVQLTFPRFEFRSNVALVPLLQQLGMEAAFADPRMPAGADFTGITAERELYITDVIHQAFISVDEEGTEAAAATAIIFGVTSMPMPATVVVDRPFLFFIEHRSTGEILFIGQVVDPS